MRNRRLEAPLKKMWRNANANLQLLSKTVPTDSFIVENVNNPAGRNDTALAGEIIMETTTVRITGSQKPTYLNGRHVSLYNSVFQPTRSTDNVTSLYMARGRKKSLLQAAA